MLNAASNSIRTRCRGRVPRHGLKTLYWRRFAKHTTDPSSCELARFTRAHQRWQHSWSYESRIFDEASIPPETLQYDTETQSAHLDHGSISEDDVELIKTGMNDLVRCWQRDTKEHLEQSKNTYAPRDSSPTFSQNAYIPYKARPRRAKHRYIPHDLELIEKGFNHLVSHARYPGAVEITLRYVENLQGKKIEGEQGADLYLKDVEPRDAQELQKYGYDVTDLRAWMDFLTESNNTTAARALRERMISHGPEAYPLSIIYHFLRHRASIQTVPLGLLVHQIRELFSYARLIKKTPPTTNELCDTIYHLLRHARRATVSLFDPIAKLLMENILDPEAQTVKYRQDISKKVNELMTLFSAPVARRPFEAASAQQAIMTQVLQFMDSKIAQFQVTRASYQALARVQLAQGKTESEKNWARLKALSWPPWKEDKLGIDSLITPARDGISAASQTIKRAREAGYPMEYWETIGDLLAGWDEDGTPTIQTRSKLWLVDQHQSGPPAIWAARIRCTRTIQEAWACWLAYESKIGKQSPETLPTLAILEKLHQAERLSRGAVAADLRSRFPGDVKELSTIPLSTHLHTYTRTAPPTVRDFFLSLPSKNVPSLAPFLPFVIAKAATFDDALICLESIRSVQGDQIVKLLLGDASKIIEGADKAIIAASIELCCNFTNVAWNLSPKYDKSWHMPHGLTMPEHFKSWQFRRHHSMLRAVYLLQHHGHSDTSSWLLVFRLLADHSAQLTHLVRLDIWPSTKTRSEELFLEQMRWHYDFLSIIQLRLAQQILQMMQDRAVTIDLPIFDELCTLVTHYSNHYYSIVKQNAAMNPTQESHSWYQSSGLNAEILATDRALLSNFLMQQFHTMLGTTTGLSLTDVQDVIQSPLIIMGPASLHSWARAVGTLGGHDALLELVVLVCNEKLITVEMGPAHAEHHLRLFIISLRVFLERGWLSQDKLMDTGNERWSGLLGSLEKRASQSIIDQVKSIIEARFGPDLGRWPDSEEVEDYVEKGPYKKLGLM